jgi:peptide/nickel transport system permease protein
MDTVKSFFVTIYRNKRAFVGFVILAAFILTAAVGPMVCTLDVKTDFARRYLSPSFEHLLGTDYVGRDLLVQLVYGARDVLFIGILGGLATVLVGFTLGAVSGFSGKRLDGSIMFVTNLFLTIPRFPVMLILAAFITISHPLILVAIIAALSWASLARSIRSQILSLKQREFITVCTVMGYNRFQIIFSELLPNLTSYLAISFVYAMQGAINDSSILILMGFAPFAPTHWGTIQNIAISQAAGAFEPKTFIYLFSPIVCFTLLQTASVFFAGGLDEALNPRLRSH